MFIAAMVYFGKRASYLEIAAVAVGVPRLHDIGRSGWLVLVAIVGEIALVLSPMPFGGGIEQVEMMAGIVGLLAILLTVWLGVVPGQPFVNKWGPPPAPGIGFGQRRDELGDTFS